MNPCVSCDLSSPVPPAHFLSELQAYISFSLVWLFHGSIGFGVT